jgi:hypothetical protein
MRLVVSDRAVFDDDLGLHGLNGGSVRRVLGAVKEAEKGRPGARGAGPMGWEWEPGMSRVPRRRAGWAPGPRQRRRLPASEPRHPSRPCLERGSRASRVGCVVSSCSLCSGPNVLPALLTLPGTSDLKNS